MMTTTADGGTVRITRAIVESRDAAGALIEEHSPTEEELLILAEWITTQESISSAAARARVAYAPIKGVVRQAAARLDDIQTAAATLANATPLAPVTTADALAAIHTLDTRQRMIGAGIRDLAAITLALGKLTLREIL